MKFLDAHILCHFRIRNPQKSEFLKISYMQISG